MEASENVGNLFFVLEYTGVALAATVGGTVAKRMNFDIVGFAFIALISSLAGGLIRDAILNDGPAAALQNPGYLITATIGALAAYFINFRGKMWDNFRFYADVITVGVWAVGGTLKGLQAELSWVPCILLAVVTSIGGTLIRDVVLRRIPGLFTSQKMYVFPAILASAMMLILNHFGLVWQGMLASAVAAPVLSMLVYWRGRHHPEQDHAHHERPLETKLGDAMGIETDPNNDDAETIANRLEEQLDQMTDEQVVDTLRALLISEVRHRAETKS